MKRTVTLKSIFRYFFLVVIAATLLAAYLPLRAFASTRPAAENSDAAPEVQPYAESAAGGEQTISDFELTVNYYRPDGKYTQWWMWLWKMGEEGVEVKFDTAKNFQLGGVTWTSLTTTITGATVSNGNVLGFLVRNSGWSKDPDVDRFVKAEDIHDNKVSIYLISKSTDFYFSSEDAVAGMQEALKPTLTDAYFLSFSKVRVMTEKAITAKSHFKLLDGSKNVVGEYDCAVDRDNVVGKKAFLIDMNADVDFGTTYTVVDQPDGEVDPTVNFSKRAVSKSTLFALNDFADRYNYDGTLGAEYSAAETKFTVWSPYASEMKLNIYAAGEDGSATTYNMTKGEKGTWTYTLAGDQKNKYYTYTVINGSSANEVVDPYARSGGRNGKRGMIIDLNSTNPAGWDTQNMPTLAGNTHAVIWEAHVRDVTIHESSGVSAANRGKFLGLTETGTKNSKGQSTALDYIKSLGVTQVHFQPLFDFATVKETFNVATYNKSGEFNWGYDPLNYNMPEGSYSSNPADGNVRVNEMKQMIMALHNAGIQVVMDVVYNHVSSASDSNFEKLMPGYYFRMNASGAFSNGSGCGNETASERYMFRKFMIDSVLYWMREYTIDGFRFDLMALHDITTMNMLYDALAAENPDVIVYGEGWTAGDCGLGAPLQASLANASKTPNIAYFDDIIRNAVKGSNFDKRGKGFVQGVKGVEADMYTAIYGATKNFSASPIQNINYVSAHDDSALWDRLNASVNFDKETLKAMNRLAATSVYTGQGIAFMLAGEEMLRSKPTTAKNAYDNRPYSYMTNPSYYFSDNSYKSPDSTNAINWELLSENADMVDYYKTLIAIKKTWPEFQLSTKAQIDQCVFVKDDNFSDGVMSYVAKDPNSNSYAVVVMNSTESAMTVSVPNGKYDIYINGAAASATKLSSFEGSSVTVGARSAVVMRGTIEGSAISEWKYSVQPAPEDESNLGLALGLGIGIPAAVLVAGGAAFFVVKNKKKKGKKSDKKNDESAGGNDDKKDDSAVDEGGQE